MMEPFNQIDEAFLHIEKWQKRNNKLRVGFTTRNGGVSKAPYATFNHGLHVPDDLEDVLHNRELLANKLNSSLENWVSGEQIHSNQVKIINGTHKGKGAKSYQDSLKGIDGMITRYDGILCTAFFADCVPLYFFDPESNYIGIAHAGWKGTVNRIAEKMINRLIEEGVNVNNILAAIGPSISKDFYEVDEHVIQHISPELVNKTAKKLENGHYLLDLKQLNVEILLQSGILRHNIDITNYCTFHDKELFFSHRRDNGQTGRMLGFIGFAL